VNLWFEQQTKEQEPIPKSKSINDIHENKSNNSKSKQSSWFEAQTESTNDNWGKWDDDNWDS